MSKNQYLPVSGLSLDLRNFRMVPQPNEKLAVHGMITINPDWFWALMESLLAEDGYLPTENILVITDGKKYTVKEGNRRIAALKLIHNYINRSPYRVPEHIEKIIAALPPEWIKSNTEVPCTIYELKDSAKVDRIVNLAHGKGEKAGRDKWEAIARARHDRDINGTSVPALDLLEKYLKHGYNINDYQRERWGGDYPFTVLDEAVKKMSPRFKLNSRELADAYPKKIKERPELESVLLDVGLAKITFDTIRYGNALDNYGLPSLPTLLATASSSSSGMPAPAGGGGGGGGGGQPAGSTQTTPTFPSRPQKPIAVPIDSPLGVMRAMRKFKPLGLNREKVATLREEILCLKLDRNPLAFCFLLRSMFEISAKLYCDDQKQNGGPKVVTPDGKDRKLVDVLRDVAEHIKNNRTDKQMHKMLHGAMTQIAKPTGLLSVTSMNQLVHNTKFTTDQTHICTVFHNIFFLVEAMNR